MKTKLLLAATVAAAAFMPSAAFAQRTAPAAVVVVDTNRVLRECTACVSATAQLQAQENANQARAQALAGPLDTERQAIGQALQAAQALTGAARTNAETALRPRIQAFEQRQQSARQELGTLQQTFDSIRLHVSVQLNQALDPIYTAVMNARGANLMVSSDARLAHAPALDVTNDVLGQLNRALPAVSVTPMPQPPATPAPPTATPTAPRPGGR